MSSRVSRSGLLRSTAHVRHARPVRLHRRPAQGGGPAPHLRHHFPPRRGQDHADGEDAALRRRHRAGRRRPRPQGAARRRLGLDGRRARARHLDHLGGARVRALRLQGHAARHARPQGLLRGHAAHAARRRQRGDGDRRRQGHRDADPQAVRGVPQQGPADVDVRQQAGPAEPRPVRAVRRDRARAADPCGPGQLADRRRRPLQGRLRPAPEPGAALRARPAQRPTGRDRGVQHRGSGAERPDRRGRRDAPARVGRPRRPRRHPGRSRGLPARRADAGVLRQRALELRPRAVPARADRVRAAAAAAAVERRHGRSAPIPTSAASCSRSRRT